MKFQKVGTLWADYEHLNRVHNSGNFFLVYIYALNEIVKVKEMDEFEKYNSFDEFVNTVKRYAKIGSEIIIYSGAPLRYIHVFAKRDGRRKVFRDQHEEVEDFDFNVIQDLLATEPRTVVVTIKTPSRRIHPQENVPYTEIRMIRLDYIGDELEWDEVLAEMILEAYTRNHQTGTHIDPNPTEIYRDDTMEIYGEDVLSGKVDLNKIRRQLGIEIKAPSTYVRSEN